MQIVAVCWQDVLSSYVSLMNVWFGL